MVLLAWLFPGYNEALHLDLITNIGVALIFFLYGLKLNLAEILQDLNNWKLHLGILAFTYIVFPLVILLFYPVANLLDYQDVWLALFFLGCLPSAIASAVMLVNLSGGNIPGAIVSASVSGLAGIILTPALMSFFLRELAETGPSFSAMVSDLSIQILLPLVVGLLLNRVVGKFFQRHSHAWTWFDKVTIWLIIYKTFSGSFASKIFVTYGLDKLVIIAVFVVLLFFAMLRLSAKAASLMKFSKPDAYTLSFCGSTKSLIHGSIMAAIIFGDGPGTGFYLLPVLLYHPLQILLGSFIAQGRGAKSKASQAA